MGIGGIETSEDTPLVGGKHFRTSSQNDPRSGCLQLQMKASWWVIKAMSLSCFSGLKLGDEN